MRKVIYKNIALFVVLLAVVSSCKIGKVAFEDTTTNLPSNYLRPDQDSVQTAAVLNWEEYFEDEQLKSLIRFALENNQDNLKTLERIKIARANLRMARLSLLPNINAMAGAARTRFGEYTMDGVGNADSNLSPTVPADKKIPDPYRDFMLGADFNWEVDVWGRLRNQKKAAAQRYLASEEMANYVKTWLISEVAASYYHMVALDEELRILEENIRLQELALKLTKDLKESGKENQLAVDQFEAFMLNSKALSVAKQRELRAVELHVSALTGTYQLEHPRLKIQEIPNVMESLRLGIPSQLLLYRPDVRMAERELMATRADVMSARAAFFPSFNLYGMAGFNAFDFSRLFLNPASTVYQLGAGLVAPVFNRYQLRAAFETANATQKIAYYDYEQTVLKSYLEVLNLVNEFKTYDEQLQLKTYEVEVQKRSVDNSNTMFMVGYANYLDVLNAQTRALQAQIELIELKSQQLQSRVRLYRALGGGWTN